MTGLKVKDLSIEAGASSVNLKFREPNKSTMEELAIEAGVSRFQADGLCNANFNHFKFEGGVGGYSLDFGGTLSRQVDVDISVGLGSLTISIPRNIGVKVEYEKNWFSTCDFDKDFTEQDSDIYYSSNYFTTDGKMDMKIEAGLGSVRVKRY